MQLFNGHDLTVVAAERDKRDILVVSFTGRGLPARVGAGAQFFDKYELPSVQFISKWNHWWQTEEFWSALPLVRAFATQHGFRRVVTYGSSMGGYGALLASRSLRADGVVAFVPQYSLDPAQVPWEQRWARDVKRIRFSKHRLEDQVAQCAIQIFSDPYFAADQHHVERIGACGRVVHLPVAFARHDVSRVLSECGMLGLRTHQALIGRLDTVSFINEYRRQRSASPLALGGASQLMLERKKPGASLALGLRGFELLLRSKKIGDEHWRMAFSYLDLQLEQGRATAAFGAWTEWIDKTEGRDHWQAQFWLARIRSAQGEGVAAIAAIKTAVRGRPTDRDVLNLSVELLSRFGTSEEAFDFYRDTAEHILPLGSASRRLCKAMLKFGLREQAAELALLAGRRHPNIASELALTLDRADSEYFRKIVQTLEQLAP